MVWSDWAEEPPPPRGILANNRLPTYQAFLEAHWLLSHDDLDGLPAKPDTLTPLYAFVNHGRWLVECPCAVGSIAPAEPGEDYLCHRCGAWHSVIFPADKDAIEQQLLALPGHRHFAQQRNWSP